MTPPRCTLRSIRTMRVLEPRTPCTAVGPPDTSAYKALRKRGLPKNGRSDAPQIVVGLTVKRDLRDWKLTRCLFVGDAGMVSAANFKALATGGGKYLMCVPLRRGDATTEQVLERAGRWRKVNERLQIKEVVIGDGERRLRYVLCFNPEEATRQQSHRRYLLEHLEAERAAMGDAAKDVHSKRVARAAQLQPLGQVPQAGRAGLAAGCSGDQGSRAL